MARRSARRCGGAGGAAAACAAALALALALAGAMAGAELPPGGVPGPAECRESFDAFFLSLDVMGLSSDAGLMSCMAGAGPGCCASIDRLVGMQSLLAGCSCHAEIWDEAWLTVAREAPALNPGSNTGMIEVAKPIVTQRMKQCGLPMPGDEACAGVAGAAGADADEPAAFPVLNRTGSQFEYSGSYERAIQGYDDYGHWSMCNEDAGSHYCTVTVQPPGAIMRVRWGVCVPKGFTAQDITEEIYNTAPDHFDRAMPEADCGAATRSIPLDAGGWAVVGVLIAIAALVALATLAGLVRQARQAGDKADKGSGHDGRSYLARLGLACFMAFDLRSNWAVLGREPSKHKSGMDLRSLNGLRVLSMLWIILGHTLTYLVWMMSLAWTGRMTNPQTMGRVIKEWYITVFTGGYFSVDSFFFMSGLLVAYLASVEIGKRQRAMGAHGPSPGGEIKFWVMFAVNRFLRLWPLFVAVIFFFWKVAPAMGSSPWWDQSWSAHSEACSKYWWADLLFISNFYPVGETNGLAPSTCIGGTWYLAVDMQLYLTVAPLVLMAWHHGFYIKRLERFRKALAVGTLSVLMAVSIICAGVLTVKHDVWLQYFGEGNFYHYYVKPWVRAPPYLWGLGAGLLLHWFTSEEAGQATFKSVLAGERVRPWAHALSMVTGVGFMAAIVFCTLDYYTAYDPATQLAPVVTTDGVGWSWAWTQAYNTLKFFVWGGAMFLFTMPMICGHGGGLNRFLGGYIWAPFAKLTFGAYLIHMLYPQMVLTASDNTIWYFQMVTFLGHWLVFTVGSYIVAAVFFLGIEAPFSSVVKALTKTAPGRGRPSQVTDAPLGRPESLDAAGSKHFPARV